MGTVSLGRSDPDDVRRIANPLHTLALLAVQGALVVRGLAHVEQMRNAVNSSHVAMYVAYSFISLLVVIAASPYFLYQAVRYKKYIGSFRQRLGYWDQRVAQLNGDPRHKL